MAGRGMSTFLAGEGGGDSPLSPSRENPGLDLVN